MRLAIATFRNAWAPQDTALINMSYFCCNWPLVRRNLVIWVDACFGGQQDVGQDLGQGLNRLSRRPAPSVRALLPAVGCPEMPGAREGPAGGAGGAQPPQGGEGAPRAEAHPGLRGPGGAFRSAPAPDACIRAELLSL